MPPDPSEDEYQARRAALDAALSRDWEKVRAAVTNVVARKIHRGSPEFHDVVHETLGTTLEDLLKQAAKYDPDRDVVPWAARFAMLSLSEVLRKRGRRQQVVAAADLGEAWESAVVSYHSLEEERRREAAEVIQAALAQMKPDQRRIIELMDLQGLNYDELHAAIGGPRGALRMRVLRARSAFGAILKRMCREEDSQ